MINDKIQELKNAINEIYVEFNFKPQSIIKAKWNDGVFIHYIKGDMPVFVNLDELENKTYLKNYLYEVLPENIIKNLNYKPDYSYLFKK